MTDPKFPRSDRTIFPKHVEQPLAGERFEKAKAAERERAKHDPTYITADEVRSLPPEVLEHPEMQGRIEYSRRDWPENRATARVALGPLQGGEGQSIEERPTPAAEIFKGSKVADDAEPDLHG